VTAFSYVEVPALGDTNLFPVPFEYIRAAHVHAYVDNDEVGGLVWVAKQLVRLPRDPSALAGRTVRLVRVTPRSDPIATFKQGGLDPGDLNLAVRQLLFISQESADLLARLPTPTWDGNFDFRGGRGINVGDPLAPQDAATATWTRAQIQSALSEVAASVLFPDQGALWRALFLGWLRSLPTEPPAGAGLPWMDGGVLSFTPGGDLGSGPEQEDFNERFGPAFAKYLANLPPDFDPSRDMVWNNGGLICLSVGDISGPSLDVELIAQFRRTLQALQRQAPELPGQPWLNGGVPTLSL
jgi:hypothetical protein